MINNLSTRMKLALLYSIKYSPEKASAKFIVPYRTLVDYLSNKDIMNKLIVPETKFNIVIKAIKNGYTITEVSEVLSWKDFEGLVANILHEFNYEIYKNIVISKPRREIDIIGIKGNRALVIDCKNWRSALTRSRLNDITLKQLDRISIAKKKINILKDKEVIPVIISLYPYSEEKLNNVYVISIDKFKDFLMHII